VGVRPAHDTTLDEHPERSRTQLVANPFPVDGRSDGTLHRSVHVSDTDVMLDRSGNVL
jgi:hypothetical protein